MADYGKQLMVGGLALRKLGSTRHPEDIYYIVFVKGDKRPFLHDEAENTDYFNANGSGPTGKFFGEVWESEAKNIGEIASPQALLELKAFRFAQFCQNSHFEKADAAEFDIKFIVRTFGVNEIKIANRYISAEELSEVNRVIASVRK